MPFHISEGGGGAEVQTWLLAKELASRGYSVTYIAQSATGKFATIEEISDVKIFWIRYVHHFRWRAVYNYYQVLKEINPDVVITRVTSYLVGVAGHYAKRSKKNFIWMCADTVNYIIKKYTARRF